MFTASSPHCPPFTPYPLLPTYYYYFFPPTYLLSKSIMRSSIPTFRNKYATSGFDGSLPPIVFLEGQNSSHVDGVLGVKLEVLVCSPHC